jgi:hypothetical protein
MPATAAAAKPATQQITGREDVEAIFDVIVPAFD